MTVRWIVAILATALGGVAGGIVGASGILCPDGSCAITGSAAGGATAGAIIGLLVSTGGCPACTLRPRKKRTGADAEWGRVFGDDGPGDPTDGGPRA